MYSYSRLRPVLIAALLGCMAPLVAPPPAQGQCVPAGPRRTSGSPPGVPAGRGGPNASPLDFTFSAAIARSLSAPSISLAPQNEGMRIPSSFGATAGYGTPAYVSMDVPRSVTLHYSSGQAAPKGFVQVDATDASTTAPERMSIRLLDASGARVTFTNGTQEIFYRAGSGATRLATQFDASSLASGAYNYTVVVRSWWKGCYEESLPTPVRVLIVNERNSPFGLGWSMPGLQRLRDQGDGVFISQGDGSGLWFAKNASGGYDAPAGDFSTVRWDAAASVWVRRYPDGTEVRFGANGLMLDVTDRLGNRTSYGYDASNRLTSVTDPVGKQITLGYTGSGALAWVQDPRGRQVNTTADGKILYRFQDPDGVLGLDLLFSGERLLGYWERGVNRSEGETARWHFDYDAHGMLARVVAPQVTTTDAGATRPAIRFTSLEAAVLPSVGQGNASNPAPRIVPQQVRIASTTPRGHTTFMAVDRFGLPTRIEEPLGRTTALTRDSHGRVTYSRAPSGLEVDYVYSGIELQKVQNRTTGAAINIAYEPTYHQPTHVYGDVTESWAHYNSQGLLDSTRVGTSTAPVTKYTYDSRGRVKSITDPEDHGTFFTYGDEVTGGNVFANTEKVEVGSASTTSRRTTSYAYDDYGRLRKATILATGDTTVTYYDLINRIRQTVNAVGGTTTHHNGAVHLDSIADPKGQVYRFKHNALGWLEEEIDPRLQSSRYGYDRAGNRTSTTNRRGRTVSFGYDELDRVSWRDADGKRTTYAYGSNSDSDRWRSAINVVSADTLRFDIAGRRTHEISIRNGVRFELQSDYNVRDLRTALRMVSPQSRSVGYRYNAFMQLDTLVDLSGGQTTFRYNDDRQLAGTTLPPGLGVGYSYPSTHVTAQIGYSVTALKKAIGVGYSHDERALIGSRMTLAQDTVRDYYYDRVGRLAGYDDYEVDTLTTSNCSSTDLVSADGGMCEPNGTRTRIGGEAYTYDAVGNRTDSGAALETGNRLTAFNGYRVEYDADGNVTRKYKTDSSGSIIYDQRLYWNSLSQLDSVWTSGIGSVRYGYNGFDQRVERTDPAGSPILYVYDGDDLFVEADGAGSPIREFAHYPGIDRPHSLRQWAGGAGGATYYYAQEHPGDVSGLIDGASNLANHYRYTPFGAAQPRFPQESTTNPLRFQGREIDGTTQLYYFRSRWYDPDLARFVSEDPIGLAGGINPYVFAGNNPVNFRDPLGLDAVRIEGITVVAPETPAEDPCRRGACWPRGGGAGGVPVAGPRGGGGGGTAESSPSQTPRGNSSPSDQCISASANAVLTIGGDLAFGGAAKVAWKAGRLARRYHRLAGVAGDFGRISYMGGPALSAGEWLSKAVPLRGRASTAAYTATAEWSASAELNILLREENPLSFFPFLGWPSAISSAVGACRGS